MTDTNQVMGALFQVLCSAAEWRTVSRKRKSISAIKPEDQPFMFLTNYTEKYPPRTTGLPDKISIEAECWCFCRADNWLDTQPSPIEFYVGSIKAALAPDPYLERQTLGNVDIQDARIEGDLDKWPGENGQAAACIKIRIILPVSVGWSTPIT